MKPVRHFPERGPALHEPRIIPPRVHVQKIINASVLAQHEDDEVPPHSVELRLELHLQSGAMIEGQLFVHDDFALAHLKKKVSRQCSERRVLGVHSALRLYRHRGARPGIMKREFRLTFCAQFFGARRDRTQGKSHVLVPVRLAVELR